jgi:uncharacterized protein
MNRRNFLKTSLAVGLVAAPIIGVGYGFAESISIEVERVSLGLPNLPKSFDGLRVAFLTDIHHGPYTHIDHIVDMVRTTLALQPDLIVLGGDYCLRERKYIAPCFEILAALSAPMGVFGVLGNHDYLHGLEETRIGMRRAGINELTNSGTWLRIGSDRIRLGGLDDLWCGKPNLNGAIGEAVHSDATLIVSHNPDYAETLRDTRVGLMLCGHTHGGQLIAPGVKNPFIPSQYGNKYSHGVVEAPTTRVYVSRGLGLTGLPVRYNCTPELTLITLSASSS